VSSGRAAGGPARASGGQDRRWLAAIVMITGALMDMIDVTIVNVALAQRHGRSVLAAGGALMAAGVTGICLAVPHVGPDGSPWPVVPGCSSGT